jgi:class 3 adenylate cyclase/tetratricopeptide (TPR) repeat protein
MQCPLCQQENPADTSFCGECGGRLAASCSACGATNLPTNKFCGTCGAPLTAGVPAGRFVSPGSYTPKHLAKKILTAKTALEGERKQVTVLFADIKGSMELLADRDPEEARKLLDPVLERMMEAVHRYEGTVNQVMGDGIMALFGAPLAYEDHAVRACYSALRMQEAVKRYAEGLRGAEGRSIHIRVGINSGEVVVRSIGSDLRMDYTAVGQTTHLAARMEQLATPGSILITASTLHLSRGYVDAKPLGPVRVKGLSEAVEVFEITGAGPVRTRLQALTARIPTRFVGRQAELEALRRVLDRVQAGYGEVVALVGEPGVGKSRLVWEFTHSLRSQGWRVLESSAASYNRATPYLSVIDLLKAYFQVEAGDNAGTIGEKITRTVLALGPTLHPALAPLLTLLEVPVKDPEWQGLEAPQRRQRTLDAVKRILLWDSQVKPLCLIFEDLHWVDTETQAFLDTLVEGLPGARLLLLVNYRPEYSHSWGGKSYYSQLRIDPLPPEGAEELLEALVGTDSSLHALKRLLIKRTQGNPFFLEESVQTLIETGVLVGGRGANHLRRSPQEIQIPDTVQAVLAARIDRLPLEDKRLLQAASVIGETVPFILLKNVVELTEEELRRGLSRLQAAEFLYETSPFSDPEYTFKHGLTYQVAYRSLVRGRRVALHARILESIERLYPDRLSEHIERLAYHAFRSERWTKAAVCLRQAGEKAFTRPAYREAVTWYEQALVALDHLPETRERQEQAIDLRLELRSPLLALAEHERNLNLLHETERLAESIGDRRRMAWTLCYKTIQFWTAGEPERATVEGERALAIAQDLGDLGLEVVAEIGLGWAYHALGDYERVIRVLGGLTARQGEQVWERFGLAGLPAVVARTWLVWSHTERGEFAEALARAEEGFRIAETANHPYSLAIAHFGFGLIHLRQGALDEAISVLQRGLEIARTFNIRAWITGPASALGHAYTLAGRVEDALPPLREAIEVATAIGIKFRQAERVAWLSEALLLGGHLAEAASLAQQALQLARNHKERGQEAKVMRLLGDLAARADPPEGARAETCYQAALTLASELGMRPLVAECHLGLGLLRRRSGAGQNGDDHLRTATSLFREMGMRFWQERSEAALGTRN